LFLPLDAGRIILFTSLLFPVGTGGIAMDFKKKLFQNELAFTEVYKKI